MPCLSALPRAGGARQHSIGSRRSDRCSPGRWRKGLECACLQCHAQHCSKPPSNTPSCSVRLVIGSWQVSELISLKPEVPELGRSAMTYVSFHIRCCLFLFRYVTAILCSGPGVPPSSTFIPVLTGINMTICAGPYLEHLSLLLSSQPHLSPFFLEDPSHLVSGVFGLCLVFVHHSDGQYSCSLSAEHSWIDAIRPLSRIQRDGQAAN